MARATAPQGKSAARANSVGIAASAKCSTFEFTQKRGKKLSTRRLQFASFALRSKQLKNVQNAISIESFKSDSFKQEANS